MGPVGSAAIGYWIAQIAFVVLLVRTWNELRPLTAVVFAVLWAAGYFGLPFILYGEGYVMPYIAMLDVIMLLMLNHRDRPLTLR